MIDCFFLFLFDIYVFCGLQGLSQLPAVLELPLGHKKEEWSKKVPSEVLDSLSEKEITRQTYEFPVLYIKNQVAYNFSHYQDYPQNDL